MKKTGFGFGKRIVSNKVLHYSIFKCLIRHSRKIRSSCRSHYIVYTLYGHYYHSLFCSNWLMLSNQECLDTRCGTLKYILDNKYSESDMPVSSLWTNDTLRIRVGNFTRAKRCLYDGRRILRFQSAHRKQNSKMCFCADSICIG